MRPSTTPASRPPRPRSPRPRCGRRRSPSRRRSTSRSPPGKKITFVSCGVEACAIQGPILAEAAATLGWTVDQVATDGSPEKVQGAIDAAIRNGSDAVILNAADKDAYAKQIADAQAAGVQFVTCCSLATAGDGILYNTATDKQNGPIGDNLAAEVVSDSGGKADVLYVNISAFQILAQVGQTFEDGMKKYCPSCTVDCSTSR